MNCSYDPREIPSGSPIGMFHCEVCGEVVIAGLPHPDYSEEHKFEEEHKEEIEERFRNYEGDVIDL
jgi:hypothetical protein